MSASIQIITSLLIPDFPSGSSINYHEGKFYLIGDDATNILVLDIHYQKIDSVHLFDYSEKRIPKADKTDLEGSTILPVEGVNHLLIVGSASRKNRKRIILIPFSAGGLSFKALTNSFHKTKAFVKRIKSQDIEEVNLEGVCLVKGDLILGNRGNRSNQNNHLIITDRNFWQHQDDARLLIRKLSIPAGHTQEILGLSELCYIEQTDTLLITLTSEATDNAFDDGGIGDSYIGWINNAAARLRDETLALDGMINLAGVDAVFKNEKIEGICVESVDGAQIILHLISDNDAGESRLFKIKMSLVV
jgi:hypothetical protein